MNNQNVDGGTLIQRIRKNDVYSDVVFYSQAGTKTLRERVNGLRLDGVFCANRDDGQFEDKVKAVISSNIKKIQDVNNLRGLVIAAASDVETLFLDVIEDHHRLLDEKDAEAYVHGLADRLQKSAASSLKDLAKLKSAKIDKL